MLAKNSLDQLVECDSLKRLQLSNEIEKILVLDALFECRDKLAGRAEAARDRERSGAFVLEQPLALSFCEPEKYFVRISMAFTISNFTHLETRVLRNVRN